MESGEGKAEYRGRDEYDDAYGDNDIMTASEILAKEYDHYTFKGEWSKILKNPQRNFTAMVYGLPGAGKSTMSLQLAEYLANHFGSVLYVSAEEHDTKTLQDNMELNGVDDENIYFTKDFRGKDLSDYKFVFIDSVSALEMTLQEFRELKDLYTKTAFILIFHATKEGNFAGKNTWKHEVDAVIEVEDGEARNLKRLNGGGVYGIK